MAERVLDLDKFVAEHNQNAELVESMTAKSTIRVAGKVRHQADGQLAVVRPRNFKLVLKSMGQPKADIGSNDDEFWFWVQGDDKSIYWCNYSDLESSKLAVTYQPDWIVEALGLKPISREEAARIKVRDTDDRDASALVFPPTRIGNETYIRMLIVSNHTRRIKAHRLYATNLQNLLAQAEVSRYQEVSIESDKGATQTCYVPENVRLEWKREQLVLDVALQDVKVNQFNPSRTALIFVEPEVPGYERVNLAQLGREQPNDNRSTARRTLPRPDPRSGVKLGKPAAIPDDTSLVPKLGSAPRQGRSQPVEKTPGGWPSAELEQLVSAPLPVTPETSAMQAQRALASSNDWSPIGR
jgi:hypothetical protein